MKIMDVNENILGTKNIQRTSYRENVSKQHEKDSFIQF